MALLATITFLRALTDITVKEERKGMTTVAGGFLHKEFNGRDRMAQIVVQSLEQSSVMSDSSFKSRQGVLTLLVITTGKHAELRRDA